MKRSLTIGTGLALAVAAAACTQQAPPAPVPDALAPPVSVAAPARGPAASNEALAWLEGNWCGGEEGEYIEETWFAPAKNESIGMSRTSRGGRMVSYEYMRILDLEGTITFVAQPDGAPPTNFKRTDGGADWIRFENPENEYPRRIDYRRDGELLLAEIGGPGEGDKEEVVSFRYTLCSK